LSRRSRKSLPPFPRLFPRPPVELTLSPDLSPPCRPESGPPFLVRPITPSTYLPFTGRYELCLFRPPKRMMLDPIFLPLPALIPCPPLLCRSRCQSPQGPQLYPIIPSIMLRLFPIISLASFSVSRGGMAYIYFHEEFRSFQGQTSPLISHFPFFF